MNAGGRQVGRMQPVPFRADLKGSTQANRGGGSTSRVVFDDTMYTYLFCNMRSTEGNHS